jgi:hypothetical protein
MATDKRKNVRIGTHSGTFHCDEALGCWMLHHTEKFGGEHSLEIKPLPLTPACLCIACIYDKAWN